MEYGIEVFSFYSGAVTYKCVVHAQVSKLSCGKLCHLYKCKEIEKTR